MAISVIGAAAPAAKSERTVFINSTQAWVAPADVTSVDILLVAGGGAGGGVQSTDGHSGGGGGGGGVLQTPLAVTAGTSYTVTIGAGGAWNTGTGGDQGGMGTNSSFGSLALSYGGQGGGGSWNGFTLGTGDGMGSGGGPGSSSASYRGGPGGGAGQAIDYTSSGATIFTIYPGVRQGYPGIALTYAENKSGNPGINGFGAGGTGGKPNSSAKTGFAGLNAGDGATSIANATSAVANRGGGGGGAAYNTARWSGTNGGSGICIIKYWSAL